VALHKWMRKMGAFLAALLAAMTNAAKRFATEVWAGYEILIADATTVTRPGSEGSTARVPLCPAADGPSARRNRCHGRQRWRNVPPLRRYGGARSIVDW
jgi:hypothetical protein